MTEIPSDMLLRAQQGDEAATRATADDHRGGVTDIPRANVKWRDKPHGDITSVSAGYSLDRRIGKCHRVGRGGMRDQ